MLKCKIKRGGTVRVKTKGNCDDIVTETLLLIQLTYQGIKEEDEYAADIYRRKMIESLLDPKSPVWEES